MVESRWLQRHPFARSERFQARTPAWMRTSTRMIPVFAPQLVSNDGVAMLRAAIASPDRYAIEPKVDGVRALVTFGPEGVEVRGRKGRLRSSWLAGRELRSALERLSDTLPILSHGSTLDGELWAGSFHRTM